MVKKENRPQRNECKWCGATFDIIEDGEVHKCRYCGNVLPTGDSIESRQGEKKNLFTNRSVGERPKFNIFICFFLLVLLGIPGIIYALIVFNSQSEWDRKNKNNDKDN